MERGASERRGKLSIEEGAHTLHKHRGPGFDILASLGGPSPFRAPHHEVGSICTCFSMAP